MHCLHLDRAVRARVLGVRHGFDADHLATIDGLDALQRTDQSSAVAAVRGTLLARSRARRGRRRAGRRHVVGGLADAGLARGHRVGVSVAFLLFGLAFLNLRAVLTTDPLAVVAPAASSRNGSAAWSRCAGRERLPAVGALFALSFDTVSKAALFALAASRFGGVPEAMLVAGLFVLGRSSSTGSTASGSPADPPCRPHRGDRVAGHGAHRGGDRALAVGLLTVARLLLPAVECLVDGRELMQGGAVVTGVLTAFVVGMLAARRHAIAIARADATKFGVRDEFSARLPALHRRENSSLTPRPGRTSVPHGVGRERRFLRRDSPERARVVGVNQRGRVRRRPCVSRRRRRRRRTRSSPGTSAASRARPARREAPPPRRPASHRP